MVHLDSTEVCVISTSSSSALDRVHSGDTDLVELAFQAKSDTARYWSTYAGGTGDVEVQSLPYVYWPRHATFRRRKVLLRSESFLILSFAILDHQCICHFLFILERPLCFRIPFYQMNIQV